MKIYNYSMIDGRYLSEWEADPDPLEEGAFLIPAYATPLKPLVTLESVPYFVNGMWVYEQAEQVVYKPLSRLTFWLSAAMIGVTKELVLSQLNVLPDSIDKTVAKIYIEEAGVYRREDPYVSLFAQANHLSEDQLNNMWVEAQNRGV